MEKGRSIVELRMCAETEPLSLSITLLQAQLTSVTILSPPYCLLAELLHMYKFSLIVLFLMPHSKRPSICNRAPVNNHALFSTFGTPYRVDIFFCAATSTSVMVLVASLGASLYCTDNCRKCADEN
jgi:hypothetical protein